MAANFKFLNNLQPEWKRHVTIVRQTKNLHETDFTQIYDFLKMNQDEVYELRAERLAKTHDPLALMAYSQNSLNFPTNHNDQSFFSTHSQQSFLINNKYNPQPSLNQNFMQSLMTSFEDINNPTEESVWTVYWTSGTESARAQCMTESGLGHIARNCTARPRRRDAAYLQTQLLISQKEEAGIQLQAEEFDFMAAAGDLDEIKDVNAKYILMENLQHASTSGTQLDKALVYDIDGSAENDNHVTSVALSIVQSGGIVETSYASDEETYAHQESIYRNLVDQVAQ
nr:hypothetical protein [Tanacetum cinerariifolium]